MHDPKFVYGHTILLMQLSRVDMAALSHVIYNGLAPRIASLGLRMPAHVYT